MGFFKKILGKSSNSEVFISKDKKQVEKSPIIISKTEIDIPIPNLQGDYAKAVFLNAYKKSSIIKNDSEYQKYLLYECGIRKPSKYHLELVREGYLEKSTIIDKIEKLKVVELKKILTELGKKTTGKKSELVQRIIETENYESVINFSSNEEYSISKKGKEFLEKNNHYVKIHQHSSWDINWKEYDKRSKPGYSFYDIVWGIFNERVIKCVNYGRTEYFYMYELLDEEGRRLDALEKLLMVLYNDVSGVQGIDSYSLYKKRLYSKKEVLEYFDISIMFAPAVINGIKKYKDIYSDGIVERIYNRYKLPIQLCNQKLFLEIVHSILDDTYSEEKIKSKIKIEYKKFVESIH